WSGNRLEVEVDLDASLRAAHFAADGSTALRLFASTSDSFVVRSVHARLAELAEPGTAAPLVAAVHRGTAPTSEIGLIHGPAERRADMVAAVVEKLAQAGRRVLVVGTD